MEIVVPEEFRYLYVQDKEHPIVKVPAPVLRQKAKPIAKVGKKTDRLIDDLIRCMKKANGVGLAAPQLGVPERVVVIAPSGMKPTPLINPVLISGEGEVMGQEGCLSIPGLYGDVPRFERVVIEAYDRRGKPYRYELEGMAARVALHEMDHLDGVLFIDKVDFATLHWAHPASSDDPVE